MFNKVKIASALVAAIATMSAQATEFDVKAGIVDQGSDEGFVIGASVEVVEGLTVLADYKSFSDLGMKENASLIEVGIKYEVGVNDFVDLVGGISYLDFDADGIDAVAAVDAVAEVIAVAEIPATATEPMVPAVIGVDAVDAVAGVDAVDYADSAFSIQAGVRTVLSDAVTFEFGVERIDWDEADASDLAPYLSASVDVSDSVSVAFSHREALDETGVTLTWAF
jgi:hypothetical protein